MLPIVLFVSFLAFVSGYQISSYDKEKAICAPTSKEIPQERNIKCLELLKEETKKALEEWIQKDLIFPSAVHVYFHDKEISSRLREESGLPLLLGYTNYAVIDGHPSNFRIGILYPHSSFKIPPEMVIIHEIVHVFQVYNGLNSFEEPAYYFAEVVYSKLFLH